MPPDQKLKATRIFLVIGIGSLILGFFTPLMPYWLGIVIFVFSLVGVGVIKVVIPPPDVYPPDLENEKPDELTDTLENHEDMER